MALDKTAISVPAQTPDDVAAECPSCSYIHPDGARFSACPRCGLIVSKYLDHSRRGRAVDTVDTDSGSERLAALVGVMPQRTRRMVLAIVIISGIAACLGLVSGSKARTGRAVSGKSPEQPHPAADLFAAVQKNDLVRVRHLLSRGYDPNAAVDGRTPVEEALLTEQIPMARLLVEKGARVPYSRKDIGASLIQECINRNLVLSVSYLLSLDIPAEDLTPKGYSPLIYAAASGYIEMVRILVDHGSSVNVRDRYTSSPLLEAAERHNTEMVRYLIAHGADVNAHGPSGYTPIMKGIKNTGIVTMLIDAGADINARSDNNTTPLHSAVSALNLEAVKLLIEKGADVSAKDDRGATPLKITTFHRNPLPDPFPEMAALLKKAGAQE